MSNNQQTNKPRYDVARGGRKRFGPPGTMVVEKAKNRSQTISRLLKYFTKEIKTVILLLITVTLLVLCLVYAPNLQSKAIDLIANHQFDKVLSVLIKMLVTFAIMALCMLLQGLLSAKLSQNVVKKMRNDLFDKIVNLPIKYIDTHPHGDIMSRMTNDVENISNTISQSLCSLVQGVLTILGTVGIMFYMCFQLALLSCTTVLLTLGVTKYLSKNMKKFFFKRQELLGELNSITEENITGYKTVMAYNKQNDIIKPKLFTEQHLK